MKPFIYLEDIIYLTVNFIPQLHSNKRVQIFFTYSKTLLAFLIFDLFFQFKSLYYFSSLLIDVSEHLEQDEVFSEAYQSTFYLATTRYKGK